MPQRASQCTITQGDELAERKAEPEPGSKQDQACRKASFRDEISDDRDSA
jgi:hypothetical protein